MKKLGVIEIKSTYVKLTTAIVENGYYKICDEIKDVVRLGEDINSDGFLKPNRIAEVIAILKGYKKLCAASGIEDVIAVVTYAVRSSKNQKSFVDEISAMLGFKVRVLSEDEEINTMYSAIVNTLDVPKGIIVNVGAESTSLAVYVRRNVTFSKTLPFGYATLANKVGEEGAQKAFDSTVDEVKQTLSGINELKNLDNEFQIVGVGESFECFARLAKNVKKYSLDILHGLTIEQKDVDGVCAFLKSLEIDKKKKLRGISDQRADFVAMGAAFIKAFYDTVKVENIVISHCGVTTGLLLGEAQIGGAERPITDVLGYCLEAQAHFNPISRTNSEHVYNLSMALFKQLRVLHKLPRTYIRSLRVGSYMHDAGMRINFYNHEKNAFNVVINESIYGLTHRELLVAAFIAGGQNAVDLSISDFTRYRDILTDEDIDAIRKLAVIVRISEAFDRCNNGTVKEVNCDILGDSIIIKAISDSDVSFEIKEAMNSAADFQRAYKKNIEVL